MIEMNTSGQNSGEVSDSDDNEPTTHSIKDLNRTEDKATVEFKETALSSTILEATFPHKLYHILRNEEYKEIISWLPHGRSWKIINRIAFVNRILPLYFRHQQFPSFKRQLSGWEFQRGIKECAFNEYHHPLFVRDRPELLLKMKRRKQKRTSKATRLDTTTNDRINHNGQVVINLNSAARNDLALASNNQTRVALSDNGTLTMNQPSLSTSATAQITSALVKALQGMDSTVRSSFVQNLTFVTSNIDPNRSIGSLSEFASQYQHFNHRGPQTGSDDLRSQGSRNSSDTLLSMNVGSSVTTPSQEILVHAIEMLRQRNVAQLLQQIQSHDLIGTTVHSNNGPSSAPPSSSATSPHGMILSGAPSIAVGIGSISNEAYMAAQAIRFAMVTNPYLAYLGNVHNGNPTNQFHR